ncbi:MAG: M67 family metallopeptidase [Fibrobacterota bacterium]|nr:M67 family metallopeptidase [Fibrobacterota bacterium]QQS04156.1 MAG: M67 family metallopeptidase [Fibrobacterota bacterium]
MNETKAPKSSQLGWDMDHVWLLRDGNWILEGEWRSAKTGWRTINGRVEIFDDTARYILGDEEGPQRLLRLSPSRANRQAFKVEVHTESVTMVGSVRSFGMRQDLTVAAGNWNMAETALQRSDASVEVDGIFTRLGDVHDAWRWILRPQPLDEVWTIPPSVVADIRTQARAGAPLEQCGLLVGKAADRAVLGAVPMVNVAASEDSHEMDPQAVGKAAEEARSRGMEILGHWHSHPFSPARQSDEDIRLAQPHETVFGVVSLMEDAATPFGLFRIKSGISLPVKLVLQS